ncbi:hypothetical protein Ddc_07065 [Ditylenchus destructor]|nr:hypothetical protein Ddc_07065 [Ditylenchus destructor]
MSRGKMPTSNSNGGTANAGGSPASAQNGNPAMARRGNKTLAWYISDKILDKNETERDSASPLPASIRAIQNSMTNRKGSMDSETSLNSTKNASNDSFDDDKRRRREKRQPRPRSRRSANGRAEKEGFVKDDHTEEQFNNIAKGQYDSRSSNAPNGNSFAAGPAKERKEDYWYYDAKSDGFYYELNGSRGWRKRNPKLHGPGGVPLATMAMNGMGETIDSQQKSSTLLPQQTSKFFPTATAANVPNIKYYDAASDGFYYEMASVDGWRRRQPVGSNGVSPPNSFSANQSQNQGQGHRIYRSTQQPIGRPLQMYSAQQAVLSRESPSPGLNNRHHMGIKQNLTNAELEDIIVQTTNVGSGKSAFSTPLNIGADRQHGTLNGGLSHNGSPASNATPTSAMFGSFYQSAHQNFTDFGMQQNSGSSKSGGSVLPPYGFPQHQQHSSSSTTISSSSLSDDHCSPPPLQQTATQNYASALLGSRSREGSQLGVWNRPPGLDMRQSQTQQKPVTAIGSFDEPYEFYWSDNEKNSSVSEKTDAPHVPQKPHPSLAAYFSDMTIQQQYNNDLKQQLKQQGERLLARKSDARSELQTKRPSTLKLSCTLQNNGKQTDADSKDYLTHCFNVDQFIADLPPVMDNEKILNTLTSLRTPMIEQSRSSHGFDPMAQDSPLFTPILLKENGYSWNSSANNGGSRVTCANGTRENGEKQTLNPLETMKGLKDIEKIWQCPAF